MTQEKQVWLINPDKPYGSNIYGFISKDRTRIDLLAGDKMRLKESLADEIKYTFAFLKVKALEEITGETKEKEAEVEAKPVKTGKLGTPLAGLTGIGPATLIKLTKGGIKTREQFFELLDKDPERIKYLIGDSVFKRFFQK